MLKTILGYLQLAHASLILYLTLQLYKYPDNTFNFNLAVAQLVLTVIDIFLVRRSFDILPIFISCTLFSSYLPPHMSWVAVLFLAKILYANDVLADAKKLIFSGDNCNFCQLGGLIYNFVRFTVVEYMFLGIVIMAYKVVVINFDKSVQQLPENYVLFYQMMVTATTIGYGDVCPKSRIQMNFFIGAIPFICGSFVIYGNNVNPLWQQFLAYWQNLSYKQQSKPQSPASSSLNLSQIQNINQFAQLASQKRQQLQNLKLTYFNDWISIASINYQKQAELIHTVIDASFPKQIKLTISSKIRQQYFPKNWVILDANDISSDLFIIADGQVEIDGQVKSAGHIFNHHGFFCQAIGGKRIVTKTFVSVWAISLNQLQELGTNCPKVKERINLNIAAYS